MYVILGGAYNGKRNYVEQLMTTMVLKEVIDCKGKLPDVAEATASIRFIMSEFETLIKPYLHLPEEEIAKLIVEQILRLSEISEVVCICTDISRGIVPLEKEARLIRDTCGRIYQKLCHEAHTVIRVWYGIPQFLKGEHHGEN